MAQEKLFFSARTASVLLAFGAILLVLFAVRNIFIVKLRPFILGFFFFLAGIFAHCLKNLPPKIPEIPKNTAIVFKLSKKLNSNEKNRRFEVVGVYKGQSFRAVLSMPKAFGSPDFLHYYHGEVFANKTKAPEYDYEFNYQKYLARKGIYYQLYLPQPYEISNAVKPDFPDFIRQKRLEVLQKIDASTLSPQSREFLKGLILADRTEMDPGITQDFTRSGLVHFLAISGTHMAVIFWFVMFLLKRIFPVKLRKVAIIISLILIWIFAIFIDYGSSVVRSCLMISVYYGFVLLQRRPNLLHSLALAAFAILFFDTNQLFDVGFQLSFIAVFGIYWLNKPIKSLFPKPKSWLSRFLLSVFSVTLAAQLITLPLILYYFHQFSLISIIANLVIVPLSEIIIVFSLLMVVFLGFIGNFTFLNAIYDFTVAWLLKFIHYFAAVDSVFFDRIAMSLGEAILLFCAVVLLRMLIINKDLRSVLQFSFVLMLFFALRIGLNFSFFNKDEALVHHFYKESVVSVKHADRVYFWVPEGADPAKVEKYIVAPYCVSMRVSKVSVYSLPAESAYVFYGGKRLALR